MGLTMDKLKKQIIEILEQWDKKEVWKGYRKLYENLISVYGYYYKMEEIKQAIKELKQAGLIDLTHLVDVLDGSKFKGSGYRINHRHLDVLKRLDKRVELQNGNST